ncbi:hypothetical protein K435DRAFT_778202 [Dendrothele bispora CBS 962.96]|uniref:Uncharacterized protein n=1 Tax=Dendrothele bispora (strain CBS 962.96) TaxID=1314807 RepID=A0A4S8KTI4_DENBC|nr:hypothetical protein K435DRAFT_785960 [Dendrothele bispora CBS 962.96]THU97171.1 hypothetical protein K435DRAFT_778202 [Dendrothele bispora CBS 962.96]
MAMNTYLIYPSPRADLPLSWPSAIIGVVAASGVGNELQIIGKIISILSGRD